VILGTFYRDKKSLPYTIINNFIITKEDLITFNSLLANLPPCSTDQIDYIATRFMLLYADILRAQYEKLVLSEDNYELVDKIGKTTGFEESDTKFAAHKRLHYQVSKLQEITASVLVNKLSSKDAFTAAYNVMRTFELLDDTEAVKMMAGKGTIRRDNYKQTYDKIETIRITIFKIARIDINPARSVKREREVVTEDMEIEPEDMEIEPEVAPVEPEDMEIEPEVAPVEPEVAPVEPEVTQVEPEVAPVEPEDIADESPAKRQRKGATRRKAFGKKTRKH